MNKVIFRPACGGLSEAMERQKSFSDVCEMLDYIVELHEGAFQREEIHLIYYRHDPRIDWETFLVAVERMYNERYEYPQAIGYCMFK